MMEVAIWKQGHLLEGWGTGGSESLSLPAIVTTLLHGVLDCINAPHAEPRLTGHLCRLAHTLMAKLQACPISTIAPSISGVVITR